MTIRNKKWKSLCFCLDSYDLRARNYIPAYIPERNSHVALEDVCKNIYVTNYC